MRIRYTRTRIFALHADGLQFLRARQRAEISLMRCVRPAPASCGNGHCIITSIYGTLQRLNFYTILLIIALLLGKIHSDYPGISVNKPYFSASIKKSQQPHEASEVGSIALLSSAVRSSLCSCIRTAAYIPIVEQQRTQEASRVCVRAVTAQKA